MKKRLVRTLALPLALGVSGLAYASGAPDKEEGPLPSRAEMWDMIQKQQDQIRELKAAVEGTKQGLGSAAKMAEEAAAKSAANEKALEEKAGKKASWAEKIRLGGELKVVGSHTDTERTSNGSDVVVDTAKISLGAEINDWTQAKVVLQHKEDGVTDNLVEVETGTITFGNLEKFPVYLTAGQFTLPFGNYASMMPVSDTLPKVFAENPDSAVQVGFEKEGFYGSVLAFNGVTAPPGRNDNIDHFGGNVGYRATRGDLTYDLGGSYTSALEESKTFAPSFTNILDHVGAVTGHLNVGYKQITFNGEYLTATEEFRSTELQWSGTPAKPSAWSAELGYTLDILGKSTTFAGGIGGTGEALGLSQPEERYMAGIIMKVLENASVGVEYLHAKAYDTTDTASLNGTAVNGTNNDTRTGSVALAVTF
ncbi:MAG: LbtU family siderophore porin [Magnetococcales bacterium]|nr:LbtU family siderophore porin [Magnetococcales bacterium]